MKRRPPTLREKKRYILASVVPYSLEADGRDVYNAVIGSATSLYGDTGTALMHPVVVFCEGGYAIVRCVRGTENECETAISLVNSIGGREASLRPVATSGTIISLKERMKDRKPVKTETVDFRGESYTSYHYPLQKVDLAGERIKTQELLFLTKTDMEEK
jgi:ribonuclease P/MRP protein subunit POP5